MTRYPNTATIVKMIALILFTGFIALAILIDILAVPAAAAPSATGSAQDTVKALESNGYKVIISRAGDVSLDRCTVTAVRPGRPVTQVVGSGDDKVTKTLYTTVYVDVAC